MKYDMSSHGKSLTNETICNQIYSDLETHLGEEKIELDFSNVSILTTTCIKGLFLKIANKISSDVFFQKIIFENVDEDLRIIISHGLEDIYN